MAKSKNASSLWAELLKFQLYKRNQGRLTRQLTAVALAVLVFFGTYTLSQGPLTAYVNSYVEVTIRYVGSQADGGLDGELKKIAIKYGGTLFDKRLDNQLDRREMIFRFPTSQRWTTRPERVTEMQQKTKELQAEIKVTYEGKVQVSKPRQQSRRAVGIAIGLPLLIAAIAMWIIFRVVNYPRFADFLISVEAEMDKVSWPSKSDLYRSTVVVISTMFFLGLVLMFFDVVWKPLFTFIGWLRIGE